MARFILLQKAEEDLIDIWLYTAFDDQEAANRILRSIEDKCHLLAKNSGLGPARPDIAPDLRYYVTGSYLILYRETAFGIEVVRVLHGARNLNDVMNKND